jgi:UDP-N-acetylmuramate dehydrogenase
MKLSYLKSSNHNIVKQGDTVPFPTAGLRGRLRRHEPLSAHTTWRVGGPAEWFYEPMDLADLIHFMQRLPRTIPVFWLGLGSNLLVRDGGLKGVVILTASLLNEINWISETTLRIEAGVSCAKIARLTAKAQLGGAEFLAGIPGTLGGALAMNAGAFGGQVWSLVRKVEVVNRQGQHFHRTVSDYQIGYRSVKRPPNEWFVAAFLELSPHPAKENQSKINELLKRRNYTQPIGLPSCGSVFRNPPNDYAARLIEQAGWKGYRQGGAQVSEKHANFIINTGQATATDIEGLIEQISTTIEQRTGVKLVPEVCIIGESDSPKI